MIVRFNKAWRYVATRSIDDALARCGLEIVSDLDDTPASYSNIGAVRRRARSVDDCTVFDEQQEIHDVAPLDRFLLS